MNIKFDKRIKCLLDLVSDCTCIADIGCDHGKLCIASILQNKAKKAIAADISEPSLKKAKRAAEDFDLVDSIDFRCGDGLNVLLEDEADNIVISGMGGELISNILEDGKEKISDNCALILSPNNKEHLLRKWLMQNNFKIHDEHIVFENKKYYQVIYAVSGQDTEYNQTELELGKININRKTKEFIDYVDYKIGKINIILKNLISNNSHDKIDEFKDRLNSYTEIKKDVKTRYNNNNG